MHRMVPMPFLAALLLYLSSSTGIAQSAVVTLAPQSGPSKFVSEIGGKPAQIGTPAQGAQGSQREQLDVAIVPPSPQAMSEPEPRSEQTSEPGAQDDEVQDDQATPDQPPGSQANSPARDEGSACDPDCDNS